MQESIDSSSRWNQVRSENSMSSQLQHIKANYQANCNQQINPASLDPSQITLSRNRLLQIEKSNNQGKQQSENEGNNSKSLIRLKGDQKRKKYIEQKQRLDESSRDEIIQQDYQQKQEKKSRKSQYSLNCSRGLPNIISNCEWTMKDKCNSSIKEPSLKNILQQQQSLLESNQNNKKNQYENQQEQNNNIWSKVKLIMQKIRMKKYVKGFLSLSSLRRERVIQENQKAIVNDMSYCHMYQSHWQQSAKININENDKQNQLMILLSKLPLFEPTGIILTLWQIIKIISLSLCLFSHLIIFAFGATSLKVNINNHTWQNQSYQYYNLPSVNMLLASHIILVLDMIIECNTMIYLKGAVCYDRQEIFNNYNKSGGLVIDIVNIFSFIIYHILIEIYVDNVASRLSLLPIILKHKDLDIIINRIKDNAFILNRRMQNLLELVNLLKNILLTSHLFACLWIFTASISSQITFSSYSQSYKNSDSNINNDNQQQNTWIEVAGINESSWIVQYLYAYYFITVTMITVGYGDIRPSNPLEVLVCIILMTICCVIFGFTINSIGEIFQDFFSEEKIIRQKKCVIGNYLKKKTISQKTKKNVLEYLEYYWKEQSNDSQQEEQLILSQLSESLKDDLLLESNKIILKENKILAQNFSQDLLLRCIPLFNEERFTPGQIILDQNSGNSDCCLFFLVQGQLDVYHSTERKLSKKNVLNNYSKVVSTLKVGNCFGEVSFFSGDKKCLSVRSVNFSKVLKIKREDFLKITIEEQEEYENFIMMRDLIRYGQDLTRLFIKCQVCGEDRHQSDICSFIHFVPRKYKLYDLGDKMSKSQERKDYKRKQIRMNTLEAEEGVSESLLEYLEDHYECLQDYEEKYFLFRLNYFNDNKRNTTTSDESQDEEEGTPDEQINQPTRKCNGSYLQYIKQKAASLKSQKSGDKAEVLKKQIKQYKNHYNSNNNNNNNNDSKQESKIKKKWDALWLISKTFRATLSLKSDRFKSLQNFPHHNNKNDNNSEKEDQQNMKRKKSSERNNLINLSTLGKQSRNCLLQRTQARQIDETGEMQEECKHLRDSEQIIKDLQQKVLEYSYKSGKTLNFSIAENNIFSQQNVQDKEYGSKEYKNIDSEEEEDDEKEKHNFESKQKSFEESKNSYLDRRAERRRETYLSCSERRKSIDPKQYEEFPSNILSKEEFKKYLKSVETIYEKDEIDKNINAAQNQIPSLKSIHSQRSNNIQNNNHTKKQNSSTKNMIDSGQSINKMISITKNKDSQSNCSKIDLFDGQFEKMRQFQVYFPQNNLKNILLRQNYFKKKCQIQSKSCIVQQGGRKSSNSQNLFVQKQNKGTPPKSVRSLARKSIKIKSVRDSFLMNQGDQFLNQSPPSLSNSPQQSHFARIRKSDDNIIVSNDKVYLSESSIFKQTNKSVQFEIRDKDFPIETYHDNYFYKNSSCSQQNDSKLKINQEYTNTNDKNIMTERCDNSNIQKINKEFNFQIEDNTLMNDEGFGEKQISSLNCSRLLAYNFKDDKPIQDEHNLSENVIQKKKY